MSDIPEHLRELVNAKLRDGETIQWIDQPLSNHWSLGAIAAFGFGICITVGTLFEVIGVTIMASGAIDIDNAIEIFLCYISAGFYLLLGLLLLFFSLKARRTTERTIYAITHRRAIVIQQGRSVFNTTYHPKDFGNMWCKERVHGTGDIYFRGSEWSVPWYKVGFANILNVKEVERMLQELKRTQITEQ
jgi:hypothetical protein